MKGPAIRRLMHEALQQRRRAQIAQRFLSGARAKARTGAHPMTRLIATLPCLSTPTDLWQQTIALHHNAEVVSFAADFDAIASVSALRLNRPI